MSNSNQGNIQKNNAGQGIDQSTIKDLSDMGTDVNHTMPSQLGQFPKSGGIADLNGGVVVGELKSRNEESHNNTSSNNKNREKVTSSQVKNRRGTDLIDPAAASGGENSNSMTLFPEINPGGVVVDCNHHHHHHRNQNNNVTLKKHNSGVKQRNTSQKVVSPPGTADGLKTNTAHHAIVGGVPEHEDVQAGGHLDVPLVGAANRRQLGNFTVKQRMSHSLATGQDYRQQIGIGGIDGVGGQHAPHAIDSLVNKQSYQHQAYISRQAANNQQIMTQSIGDASNASYVFDGGSQLPTRGGEYSQFVRAGGANTTTNQIVGGCGTFPIDSRSLSNESSPTSQPQRRNLMYRNVRNFNNLYENRSLASKNIEMQDQLRLGGAQKLWNFRRADPLFPSINDQRFQQSTLQTTTNQKVFHNNNNSYKVGLGGNESLLTDQNTLTSGMTQMKRIKRSLMEDGSNQPKLELRQSPISSNNDSLLEKPGTHHGYQSEHYYGNLAHTDPKAKQNTTANSFNARNNNNNNNEESWQTHTMNNPFIPELSISSNFYIDSQINILKPILRRNCLHNRNNIVIQWKSFEIWVIQLEYASKDGSSNNKLTSQKILNPVYVPLTEMNHLLTLSPSQIELRIVRSLQIGPNGKQFIYVPQEVPATNCSDLAQADDCGDLSRKQSLNSPTKLQINSPKDATAPSGGTASAYFGASDSISPVRSVSGQNNHKTKQQFDQFDQSFGATQSSATNLLLLDDKLPEEIYTSLYMQHASSDFAIVIRPPCIEYSMPSRNFLFMKTLTREENNEFISNRFSNWQSQAIKCLTRYTKFNELLAIIDKGQDYKMHLARMEAQRYQKPMEPAAIVQPPKPRAHTVKKSKQQQMMTQGALIKQACAQRDKTGSASQMQVYVLEEASGQIMDYNSLNDFKRQRIQPSRMLSRPHGCFNQNGSFGTIQLRPFAMSVKGLDSDYEYRYEYKTSHWKTLIGFMQYKCMKRPDDAKQLVDKLCKNFKKSLKRAHMKASKIIPFKATSVFISKKSQQKTNQDSKEDKQQNSKIVYPLMNEEEKINESVNDLAQTCICEPSKTMQKLTDLRNNAIIGNQTNSSDQVETQKQQIPQQQSKDSIEQQRKRFIQDSKQALRSFLTFQKRSKMLQVPQDKFQKQETEQQQYQQYNCNSIDASNPLRYLIEIEFPQCKVTYQGQSYQKPLTEEDLVHLVSIGFCRWKNYLMTKHFRLELNIGNEKPLPRIMEDKRGEDDLISETDPREKFPITEAEKPKIEQTQGQVTNWFGV